MSAFSAAAQDEDGDEIRTLRAALESMRDAARDDADEIARLRARVKQLHEAIKRLHAAKGRYHTQHAICDLFDLVGLKNERPTK